MQWLFIAVVLTGAGYFTGVRRRLDAFVVAFFSAAIYFLPGLVGYTLSPTSPRSPIKLPVVLEAEAIGIMVMVTVLILVGGVLWDQWDRRRPAPYWVLEDSRLATWVALGLGVLGVALTVVESGGAAFTEGSGRSSRSLAVVICSGRWGPRSAPFWGFPGGRALHVWLAGRFCFLTCGSAFAARLPRASLRSACSG